MWEAELGGAASPLSPPRKMAPVKDGRRACTPLGEKPATVGIGGVGCGWRASMAGMSAGLPLAVPVPVPVLVVLLLRVLVKERL